MAAADLIPILTSLLERGKTFSNSEPGIESNNKVQATLGGREGAALSRSEELAALLPDGAPFSTTEPPRYLRLPDVDEGGSRMSPLVYFDGDLSSAKPYMTLPPSKIRNRRSCCTRAFSLLLEVLSKKPMTQPRRQSSISTGHAKALIAAGRYEDSRQAGVRQHPTRSV
jgi:hypothetical protein